MAKVEGDGEPQSSAGRDCPALERISETEDRTNEITINGERLRIVQATAEELAAITQCLKERADSAPAGARIGRASALARAGMRFFAVVLLAAGVEVGLGDGDVFDNVGCSVAQQPSRPSHVAAARQARKLPDGKVPGSDGGAGSNSDDGGPAGRPECKARCDICKYRMPDGRCQATNQPCSLFGGCEQHGSLDDIRAMLAEIRTGVVGLAPGPPAAVAKKPIETTELRTIGRFQYRAGFKDVWLGGEHYDLRGRAKARLCIQYLVAKRAFAADSARHLETEIDPFVRKKCRLPPLPDSAQSNLRIQHFFNDPSRKLSRLRLDLVKAAGRNGCFYLQVI